MIFRDKEGLKAFANGLNNFAKQQGLVAIKINPLLIKSIYNVKDKKVMNNPEYQMSFNNITENGFYHLGYNNYFEALKPRFEAIINISKDASDVFLSFEKETKTKIRSASKKGVIIYKGNEDNIEDLLKLISKKFIVKATIFMTYMLIIRKMIMLIYIMLNLMFINI